MLRRSSAAAAIAVCIALLLAGCASKPEPVPIHGLPRIVRTNELRVGTSGDQPPLSMVSRNGDLLGLDVALARVLAQSMGVEVRFVQQPFGQLLDSLERGEVDLVMSGVTITPERSARVTFVGPYYTSGKAVLARSEELANVAAPRSLDRPDLAIAVLAGSTSEAFVRESMPQAVLVPKQTLDEAIAELQEGAVDVLVADRETCAFAVLRHPDAGLVASSSTFTVEPLGIAVPLDDPKLANLVEIYFASIRGQGTLEKLSTFWFEDPTWVKGLR